MATSKRIAAMPAFNVEGNIGTIVLKTKQHVDEVVVVDDGSRDATADAARAAGAKVVSHGTNRGYGEAIKSCFAAARTSGADVLVIFDADGQHDSNDIPRLLAPILHNEADLTVGSRFLDSAVSFPRYRKFGIEVINWLWNFGSKTKVSDTQSGFRAYSRELIDKFQLTAKGMSISVEILEKARRRRARIKEVPVSCSYEDSSLNWAAIEHGLGVALAVLAIRLKYGLLDFFGGV